MIINIKGGKPRQKELVRSMVKFAHKKLMPRMKNLELNICIKDFGKDTTPFFNFVYLKMFKIKEYNKHLNIFKSGHLPINVCYLLLT